MGKIKFFFHLRSFRKRLMSSQVETIKVKAESNVFGSAKLVCWAIILLVQLVLIILSFSYLIEFLRGYFIVCFILSWCTALFVISTDKCVNSKFVWVIILIFFSSFGFFLYFISSETVCFSRFKKRYNIILERTKDFVPLGEQELFVTNKAILNDLSYLKEEGNFPTFKNTKMNFYPSGASCFDDILCDVSKAQKFIFMEFFIVSDGVLLERILSILKEKAESGVDVRIIYDDLGSARKFKARTKKRIKEYGIKIISFNRLVPIFSVKMNFRDHRKIVIVDGQVSYTGGINLSDEYINERRLFGYWKDAGIRLDGSATDMMTVLFLRQWEFLTKVKEDYSPFLIAVGQEGETANVCPYANGLDYRGQIAKKTYMNMIASAQEKVYVMSPYLVIDDAFDELIVSKIKSGVDVRIVIPYIPDKRIVYYLTYSNALKFASMGAKIYKMRDSFVHSKLVLTENSVVVGSINMDMRSFYQQYENAVYTDSDEIMNEVYNDFLYVFDESTIIDKKHIKKNSLLVRIFVGVLRLFSPLM